MTPLRLECGRCARPLGRLAWPDDAPAAWADPAGEALAWEWLARGKPITTAGRPRARITNPAPEVWRLEATCKCGHTARLRLHSIARRATPDRRLPMP